MTIGVFAIFADPVKISEGKIITRDKLKRDGQLCGCPSSLMSAQHIVVKFNYKK